MESVQMDENDKICADCKTSKTPLWRSGPAGPKSLCNACGIRYRKKKSVVGSDKQQPSPSTSPPSIASSSTATATASTRGKNRDGSDGVKNGKLRKKLRIKLVALGKEVVLMQRQRSPTKKKKKRQKMQKMGEVEQAAFLLMSLSAEQNQTCY